jgi:hypothetical protein
MDASALWTLGIRPGRRRARSRPATSACAAAAARTRSRATARATPTPTATAPRGALLYPRRSREELEGMFLGPMAHPDPKGERNNRMPGKRRSRPGVRGEASRDPRDMAKAGLPEAESPDDEKAHPPERHLLPAPCSAMAFLQGRRNLRGVERCPVRAIKEMSRTPKSRSDVRQGRTRDQPTGREPQGDGGPMVVAGAPRGAMRKEMQDDKHLVRAGWNAGPGLMQQPGEAGDGRDAGSRVGGQASRQRDGRAALPDARVRASETER